VHHYKTCFMANDRDINQHGQVSPDTGNAGRERTEQFNELSELSLEERMAVADQIGVPVQDAGEAAAMGTISGGEEGSGTSYEIEEESMDEETDR
jgi:hypothetical protein